MTKKFRKSCTVPKKLEGGTLLCFSGRPFVSFFCFAQASEISSVLNFRVLNLPQVFEQMN